MANFNEAAVDGQARDPDRDAVRDAILATVLPACYAAIDALIDVTDQKAIPKQLLVACRRLLPKQYKHSFEAPKQ